MPRHFKLDTWYSITRDLYGEARALLYLNGRVSYDPNGLLRIGDSFESDYIQDLVDLMDSSPTTRTPTARTAEPLGGMNDEGGVFDG